MAYRRSQIPNFRAIRTAIEEVAVPALFEEVEDYAEEAKDALVEKMEQQGFRSFQVRLYPDNPLNPNLSWAWTRRKELASADLRTMIATGWYISHIEVHSRKGRGKAPSMTFFVGPDSRFNARDLKGRTVRDMSLDRLAKTHEHGTLDKRIPARPHWTPQLNLMTRAAPKTRKRIANAIAKQLFRRAILRRHLEKARKSG